MRGDDRDSIKVSDAEFALLREGGEVVAEWWPGRGTTRAGGRRGRRCREVADFIRWIKSEGRI
jgi:hypothetical protein